MLKGTAKTYGIQTKLPKKRMEELLEAAELGSVPHIFRLEDVFPGGMGFIKRAVFIVLRNLERGGKLPIIHVTWNIRRIDDESQLAITRGSFAALEDVLGYMEKGGQRDVSLLVEIFHRNMGGFTSALKRCADFSSAVTPGYSTVNPLYHLVGSNYAHRLLNVGMSVFEAEEERTSLTALVDHIVRSWLLGVGDKSPSQYPTLSPSDFNLISMGTRALWKTYNEDAAREILVRKLHAMEPKALKRFAETFTYYCTLWMTAHKPSYDADPKTTDCRPLLAIITIAHKLAAHVGPFRRALALSRFPGWSIDLAWQVRKAPSISKHGGSMAADVACVIFPAWTGRAWEASQVIPQLLDSGLLDIIADDALDTREKDLRRWSGQDPLLSLWRASHHPAIRRSLIVAEARLPMEQISQVEEIAPRFATFKNALLFYSYYVPADDEPRTLTCACVEHDNIGMTPITKMLECSQCRTAAYCSKECQTRDWKMHHRKECLSTRVHRIDCQLRAVWLSYKTRMRYLDALQPILQQILARINTLPPDSLPAPSPDTPPRNPIWLAGSRDVPMEIRPCSTAEDFLSMTGETLAHCPSFVNERFSAIIKQYEWNRDAQMVGCAWKIGDVWVTALGVFNLRESWKTKDGTRERFQVLNGHVNVRVFPATDIDYELMATGL